MTCLYLRNVCVCDHYVHLGEIIRTNYVAKYGKVSNLMLLKLLHHYFLLHLVWLNRPVGDNYGMKTFLCL